MRLLWMNNNSFSNTQQYYSEIMSVLEKGTLSEILPLSWNSQPVRMDTDPAHPHSLQR